MQPALASLDRVIHDLARRGWSVAPHFLSQGTVDFLAEESVHCMQESKLRAVGSRQFIDVGANEDFILWLQEPMLTSAQREYLQRLDELRMAANVALGFDLQQFEGHLAAYPPGGYYHKHKDSLEDEARRALTCILYLNTDWEEEDGGQLRLYLDDEEYFDILPRAGTLVAFLSDRFWHEVLPMKRNRMSITGWFKIRETIQQ